MTKRQAKKVMFHYLFGRKKHNRFPTILKAVQMDIRLARRYGVPADRQCYYFYWPPWLAAAYKLM